MMLLCPLDHNKATKGALSEEQQRRHKASPLNIQRGMAQGALVVNQNYCAVAIGGVFLVGEGSFIVINDEPILSLRLGEGGSLAISLSLYDESGSLIALIEDNEWIAGDPLPWDMESDHQLFRLRSAPYNIGLEIKATYEPVRLKGSLWKDGHNIRLRPAGLYVNGPVLDDFSIHELGLVGLGIAINIERGTMEPFGDSAVMVSEADPMRRLVGCMQALETLRHGPSPLARRLKSG